MPTAVFKDRTSYKQLDLEPTSEKKVFLEYVNYYSSTMNISWDFINSYLWLMLAPFSAKIFVLTKCLKITCLEAINYV